MPAFPHDDFLLETELARELYHGTARNLPIIDYHCHVSLALMAEDHRCARLPKSGWTAITTSGAPCAPAVYPSI